MFAKIKDFFKSLPGRFVAFVKGLVTKKGSTPTPVATPIATTTTVPADKPLTTDESQNKLLDSYLGRTDKTTEILNSRVGQGSVDRDASGYTLDSFGVWRANTMVSGKPETYTITVPTSGFNGGGFEFVWGEATNSIAATVTVDMIGPAGSFHGTGNQHNGSVPVHGAKPGETYLATITYQTKNGASQVAHAQINPL